MKDAEVLVRLRKGDESAMDFLYTKYYRMMVKLVRKNSGTEEEARDIYQDALIVFWQKARKEEFILTSRISTYLYSVCNNLWLKELERKSRLRHENADSAVVHDYEQGERIKAIRTCIEDLGDTCKKVLSYYYFDGMSMKVIAEKLGFANAETAKTKKYKCKKALDQLIRTRFKASDFMD
jgi:RNA polymerase sigma factor (sigma-70 family)